MENIIMPLYKSVVQPHLEYYVQYWLPCLKRTYCGIRRDSAKSANDD